MGTSVTAVAQVKYVAVVGGGTRDGFPCIMPTALKCSVWSSLPSTA